MTSPGSEILLVGLKGSGKTSYLAALWHLVEAGELPASLRATQLQPDRAHLNRIRGRWLSFTPVGRTSLQGEEEVTLLLEDAGRGERVDLVVPDLSGESFLLQWTTRRATERYALLAKDCKGVLLFVHPDDIRTASRIVPVAREKDEEVRLREEESEWAADEAPTDVVLVELLQFIQELRGAYRTLRVGVIVSAWDLVRDRVLPVPWLERKLPLLAQFLRANGERLTWRAYGVSALGGDLERDRGRLQGVSAPARRVRVIDSSLRHHHDLTAPLAFVLGFDRPPRQPAKLQ